MRNLVLLLCALVLALPGACRAASLPADPFARLLYRLDHAPMDLEAAARSSRHGGRLQGAAEQFSGAMRPITPSLKAVADNRALNFLGRVPIVSGPARLARGAVRGAASISENFDHLVELDKAHVQPLREASIAAANLRHSRNRRDLPAATRAFRAAFDSLRRDESAILMQRQRLARTAGALRSLAQHVQSSGLATRQTAGSWRSLQSRLGTVRSALDARIAELGELRRYTGDCAADGAEALKT